MRGLALLQEVVKHLLVIFLEFAQVKEIFFLHFSKLSEE